MNLLIPYSCCPFTELSYSCPLSAVSTGATPPCKHAPYTIQPHLHWVMHQWRHLGPLRPWAAAHLLGSHLCRGCESRHLFQAGPPAVLEDSLAILSRNAFNNINELIKSSEGPKKQAAEEALRNDSQAKIPRTNPPGELLLLTRSLGSSHSPGVSGSRDTSSAFASGDRTPAAAPQTCYIGLREKNKIKKN